MAAEGNNISIHRNVTNYKELCPRNTPQVIVDLFEDISKSNEKIVDSNISGIFAPIPLGVRIPVDHDLRIFISESDECSEKKCSPRTKDDLKIGISFLNISIYIVKEDGRNKLYSTTTLEFYKGKKYGYCIPLLVKDVGLVMGRFLRFIRNNELTNKQMIHLLDQPNGYRLCKYLAFGLLDIKESKIEKLVTDYAPVITGLLAAACVYYILTKHNSK